MAHWLPPAYAGWVRVAFCALALAPLTSTPVHAQSTRTLIVVAHQDDDFAAAAGAAAQIQAGDPVRTVYLTSGDAAEGCDAYVRSREQGVKEAYAHLAGQPGAPDCAGPGESGCWLEDERFFFDKRVRVLELKGTPVSLAFFGFPNPGADNLFAYLEPTLERLWAVPGATVTNLPLDGRGDTDTYTKEELIEALRSLLEEFAPTEVVTHDPNRQQILVYPFEHTDHVHTGLFTFAALQRWGQPVGLTMERGYSTMFLPANRSGDESAAAQELVDIYLPYDDKICTGSAMLCGQPTQCFGPELFDLAKEHYYTVGVETGGPRRIRTPGNLCLDALGSWVVAAPCLFFSGSQRWQLLDDGRIRHVSSGRCLASPDGASVSLARCSTVAQSQHFSLLTNGALLGPDARCMAVTAGLVGLEGCALDLRQTPFAAH